MNDDRQDQARFPELDAQARFDMLIDGAWVQAADGATFRCHDPYEDEPWGHVPVAGASDVDRAVTAASAAFQRWRQTPLLVRLALMEKLAQLVAGRAEEFARLQVHENGKTIAEMRRVAQSLPGVIRYYGHLAESLHGYTVQPNVPNHQAWTVREPLGVIAAIAPWNNPLGLLAWKVFPALAAGNTVVIKPSEVTPASTLELARLAQEAGFPAGVVNVLTGAAETGRLLVDHPGVAKVAFTGSTAAGQAIATALAPRFVPSVLELGGKGPNIVFADADLDRAVAGVVVGLTAGSGQACNAGSRILVDEAVAHEFTERLTVALSKLVIGDPLDPGTDVGPMASPAHFDRVSSYLGVGADEGHRLLYGGRTSSAVPGRATRLFVEPTVFEVADHDCRLTQEEVFGPIGALMRFSSEREAVELANAVPFGLVAGLWTQDIDRAHRVSRKLEAGVVWLNTWRMFSNNVPFGGTKMSGWGREAGIEAVRAFTEEKSIWLEVRPEA